MTTTAQQKAMVDAVQAVGIDWYEGAITAKLLETYPLLLGEGEAAKIDQGAAKRAAREIAARYPFLVRPALEERIADILGPDVPPPSGRPVGSGPRFAGRPGLDNGSLRKKYPALGV